MKCHFPEIISAGLTFSKTLTLTAYPAPDWALSVYLRGPGVIDLDAQASGTQHQFTETATTTATWAPGTYWFSLRAKRGDEIVEIESGQVVVKPDMAAATEGFDGRNHTQRVLEAIEAVLERRATQDQERYTINNRELWRTPIPDLLVLRDRYRSELRRQNLARKGGLFNSAVRVRFK